MFNIFKRKYKRSDWLEGVIEAEHFISSGFEANVFEERGKGVEITFIKGLTTYKIKPMPISRFHFIDGVLTYLDYFENNLKNL